MDKSFSRRRLIAGAGALAFASTLTLGSALAQTPESTGTPQNRFQSFIAKLAGKLGKSEDEVRAAIVESRLEWLEEAIESGRIRPELADHIRSRIQNGEGPFIPFGRMGKRGGGPRAFDRGPGAGAFVGGPFGHHLDAVTSFLGVTREELADELRAGKSLATIAQEKGKSRDELKATIETQTEQAIRERSQGRLSEEQIQQYMDRFRSSIDRMIDATPRQFKFRAPTRNRNGA